mmetsp:Transcript_25912/g.53194  ORF Transcript_25912/g.53194 Transcript_25912/m.53194 type:complete len:271 (+) Transcript_25912:1165-1977(+)
MALLSSLRLVSRTIPPPQPQPQPTRSPSMTPPPSPLLPKRHKPARVPSPSRHREKRSSPEDTSCWNNPTPASFWRPRDVGFIPRSPFVRWQRKTRRWKTMAAVTATRMAMAMALETRMATREMRPPRGNPSPSIFTARNSIGSIATLSGIPPWIIRRNDRRRGRRHLHWPRCACNPVMQIRPLRRRHHHPKPKIPLWKRPSCWLWGISTNRWEGGNSTRGFDGFNVGPRKRNRWRRRSHCHSILWHWRSNYEPTTTFTLKSIISTNGDGN